MACKDADTNGEETTSWYPLELGFTDLTITFLDDLGSFTLEMDIEVWGIFLIVVPGQF